MTPTDWKNPELANNELFISPRDSEGTRKPCVITAMTITAILTNARAEALANCSYTYLSACVLINDFMKADSNLGNIPVKRKRV